MNVLNNILKPGLKSNENVADVTRFMNLTSSDFELY
jgi:hypothetical protein